MKNTCTSCRSSETMARFIFFTLFSFQILHHCKITAGWDVSVQCDGDVVADMVYVVVVRAAVGVFSTNRSGEIRRFTVVRSMPGEMAVGGDAENLYANVSHCSIRNTVGGIDGCAFEDIGVLECAPERAVEKFIL